MDAVPPDDALPTEPGLDQLLGMLTAGGTAAELGGQRAALAMFRDNRPSATPELATPGLGTAELATAAMARRRHPRPFRVRLAAIAAAVVIVGGLAAAAYGSMLPAPVQHVAYRVLGFAGVPDVHHSHPQPAGSALSPSGSVTGHHHHSQPSPATGSTHPARRRASSSSSSSPRGSGSSSASPAPPGPVRLSVVAARPKVVAGTAAVLVAQLTRHGNPVRGAALTLLEHVAGQSGWQRAGRQQTSSNGSVTFTVPDLTTNATFRVTGPGGARSRAVPVLVAPPVSVSVQSIPNGRAHLLVVSSPLAAPGNAAVLQVFRDGSWQWLRAHDLGAGEQTEFRIKPHAVSLRFRVILPATATHGRSHSEPVEVIGDQASA